MSVVPPIQPVESPRHYAKPRQQLAILAFVFGLAGFCCPPFAISGIVLAAVALTRISHRPDEFSGKGFAVAGLAISCVSLIVSILVLPGMIMTLFFSRARSVVDGSVDQAHLRAIRGACTAYASENDGVYPPALQTLVRHGLLTADELQCPLEFDSTTPGGDYYYVAGLTTDADPRWPLAWTHLEYYASEGSMILFAGGKVEFVEPEQLAAAIALLKKGFESANGAPPTIVAPPIGR